MFQYTIWWSIRASTAVGSTMWRQSQHQRHSSYARRGNFNHLPPTWRGYTYQLLLRGATTSQLRLTMTRVSGNFYYYMDSKELLASPTTSTTTSPLLLRGEPINYQSTTTRNYVQSSQTITMWSSSSSLRLFTNYDDPPTTHQPTFTTTTAVSNC